MVQVIRFRIYLGCTGMWNMIIRYFSIIFNTDITVQKNEVDEEVSTMHITTLKH